MTRPPGFDPQRDAVYFDAPLRHTADLPVLGVPVRFESNSAVALGLFEEAFGEWRALAGRPELLERAGARFRLVVHDGDEGPTPHAPVTYRMPDPDRLILQTPGSIGIVDAARREATAFVTPALLADRAHVSYALIQGLTLTLVSARNRWPVHAAAIARGSTALLLAGPPGTGKSTLAYQAHHRGLRVLSDDAAYVQLEPEFRLWGTPGHIYLVPEAGAHFPELAGRAPTLQANGSEKVVVEAPGEWPARAALLPFASRAGVCLLERTGSRVSLARVNAAQVSAFLKEGLGISRFRFGAELDGALARLAAAGGWRLSLSGNPADAAPLLDEVLAEVETRA
jgi:hypothetical protein